jgi:hypothetical protein
MWKMEIESLGDEIEICLYLYFVVETDEVQMEMVLRLIYFFKYEVLVQPRIC